MKIEVERRRTQGVAGEWEVVERSTSTTLRDETDVASEPSKKREAEGPLDLEDTRSFKLRKKIAPSVTDDWEGDMIPVKLKVKKTEEVPEPAEEVKEEEPSEPIKWTSRGWKRQEDEPDRTPNPSTLKDMEVEMMPTAAPEPVAVVSEPETKKEPEAPPVKVEVEPPTETVVFRKRKSGVNRGKR